MTDSERNLLEAIHANPEAFRPLYRAYFPRVYAYVAYRIGDVSDAEDVVADIFVNVVESLDRFEYRGEGSFAAWLFRIAHNRVSQYYRQQRPPPLSLEALPELHSDSPPPDQTLMQQEQSAHLRSLIATLSPRRQEIVMLKFFGGLRNQEVAAVLNLDERTVASHLCRALDDLQEKLRDEPFHDPSQR